FMGRMPPVGRGWGLAPSRGWLGRENPLIDERHLGGMPTRLIHATVAESPGLADTAAADVLGLRAAKSVADVAPDRHPVRLEPPGDPAQFQVRGLNDVGLFLRARSESEPPGHGQRNPTTPF